MLYYYMGDPDFPPFHWRLLQYQVILASMSLRQAQHHVSDERHLEDLIIDKVLYSNSPLSTIKVLSFSYHGQTVNYLLDFGTPSDE